jgi:hypothetical protein
LEEALEHTRSYIRSTLGRQKLRFDRGEVEIKKMWDVTDLAIKLGKHYPHAKIDDYIRHCIPFHAHADIHQIDADEAVVYVNEYLKKTSQGLPSCDLSTMQYTIASDVIDAIGDGARTILAELCARFGKTIWSGALIRETAVPLTIISSYMLTSHASFLKDLTSYEQFKGFAIVNMNDDDAYEAVNEALRRKLQVGAFMSLNTSTKRSDRFKFLFGKRVQKLMFVDEADYGAHRPAQTSALMQYRKKNDIVVLMTGTNADRAISTWDVDYTVSVTYPELLIQKKKIQNA